MLSVRPFRQDIAYCGPASLKAVLRYYGIRKTERDLATLTKASKKSGTKGENMVKAAKELGLDATLMDDAEISDIRYWVREKEVPVIVDWWSEEEGHYSIVVWINAENIYLMDPEWGQTRALRISTFKRNWFDFSGNYLKKNSDLKLRRMIVIRPHPIIKKKSIRKRKTKKK